MRAPRFVLAVSLSTLSAALVASPLFYRALQVRSGDIAAIDGAEFSQQQRPTTSSADVDETTRGDAVIAADSMLTTISSAATVVTRSALNPTSPSSTVAVETPLPTEATETTPTTPSTPVPEAKPTTVSTGPGPEAPTTQYEGPTKSLAPEGGPTLTIPPSSTPDSLGSTTDTAPDDSSTSTTTSIPDPFDPDTTTTVDPGGTTTTTVDPAAPPVTKPDNARFEAE